MMLLKPPAGCWMTIGSFTCQSWVRWCGHTRTSCYLRRRTRQARTAAARRCRARSARASLSCTSATSLTPSWPTSCSSVAPSRPPTPPSSSLSCASCSACARRDHIPPLVPCDCHIKCPRQLQHAGNSSLHVEKCPGESPPCILCWLLC